MGTIAEIEDVVAWPFVVSVIPPVQDLAFTERFFARLEAILERGQNWVHLIDARLTSRIPDPRVRNLMGQRTKALKLRSARYTLGSATVVDHALVRGVLTAIEWVAPPSHPTIVVATPAEGVAFLRGCLRKANLPEPERMGPELVDVVSARVLDAHQRSPVIS